MKLADSHCHLDDSQFDADREQAIERARAAGIEYMLAIGTGSGPPDLEAGVRLAETYPFIFATAGVHPNDAPKADANTFRDLEKLLRQPHVKALGEIGLDHHWGVAPEMQMPVFLRQLEMAAEARLPVIIHTRDAWEATLGVLRRHWAHTDLPCVMHCFTGDAAQARECLDLGFYLAFGGVTTFPKSAGVREAARLTPGSRLLIETDAPYLAPVPHRGKRNEPAFVADTARALAEIRGVSLEELARETTGNFERLFNADRTATSYTENSGA
ncbi:MAG: TatD family hydrolase [Bryobacteraceae bacterium]